ncbi:MAG TPA: hypothetical protein VFX25_19215 [Streptosporangiaceae bacterium]|nr:hypothetical protein [Streptosporangiaceae bacterium]
MKSPARWRSAWTRLTSVRWPATARLLLGVVGLALLILGAVKFAGAAGDAGPVTLVVAGVVLLVSPFILDRLQRGPAPAPRLDPWIATQVSERSAPQTAAILQRTRLGSFAEAYALVHDELTEPEYRSARIHLQDLLIERAASVARQEILDAREVRRLYAGGSVVVRVLVLGLMQGDRSLADVPTMAAALLDSRSAHEQYQGLQLVRRCWPALPSADRQDLRSALEQASLEPGCDRWHLAQDVLRLPVS